MCEFIRRREKQVRQNNSVTYSSLIALLRGDAEVHAELVRHSIPIKHLQISAAQAINPINPHEFPCQTTSLLYRFLQTPFDSHSFSSQASFTIPTVS